MKNMNEHIVFLYNILYKHKFIIKEYDYIFIYDISYIIFIIYFIYIERVFTRMTVRLWSKQFKNGYITIKRPRIQYPFNEQDKMSQKSKSDIWVPGNSGRELDSVV